ncbi:hypothetical protein B0E53_05250 [Micromonospora sp. MH33]|nr:hypothetical protein B0E53_05250 [Micromonospora sp. MH33]
MTIRSYAESSLSAANVVSDLSGSAVPSGSATVRPAARRTNPGVVSCSSGERPRNCPGAKSSSTGSPSAPASLSSPAPTLTPVRVNRFGPLIREVPIRDRSVSSGSTFSRTESRAPGCSSTGPLQPARSRRVTGSPAVMAGRTSQASGADSAARSASPASTDVGSSAAAVSPSVQLNFADTSQNRNLMRASPHAFHGPGPLIATSRLTASSSLSLNFSDTVAPISALNQNGLNWNITSSQARPSMTNPPPSKCSFSSAPNWAVLLVTARYAVRFNPLPDFCRAMPNRLTGGKPGGGL